MKETKGNKQKHLSDKERFCIERMIKAGLIYQDIANALGRSLRCIKEEVRKNGGRKRYRATNAIHRAYLKQYWKKRHCNKVAMQPSVQTFVERSLRNLWSPEDISLHLKRHNKSQYVSPKSIRKYIQSRPHVERYLFWNRNKKKTGPKSKKLGNGFTDARVFIEERPTTENEYGHWEADFIVSKHNRYVLLVLVEKLTRFSLVQVIPNRINLEVNKAITEMLQPFKVETLTTDNDIAFTKWKNLEYMLQAPVYFTHPYCSWEKGLVENTNRWIRSFIGRKVDMKKLPEGVLVSAGTWLNDRPRQCLYGETSRERMIECEERVLLSSNELEKVHVWG